MPTSTAAAPTKLCSMATSSGIDVIATRAARKAPIRQPTASAPPSVPTTVQSGVGTLAKSTGTSNASAVITAAISMPMTPRRLPRWAVSWLDSPRKLRMNSRLATRYASARMVVIMVGSLPEHAQHPLRDEETAGDIDRGDQHRDAAQHQRA